ncbi:phage tail tape measure protein [Bradyrhizobium sp. RT4b]|uniref:phage tail tape measure protein n=1 Tax=unclassified Bradyrhizobium TaxID=2631580 RepID=UPI003398FCED
MPIEQLSALAYAADLSDVSFDALSKSVGKLSKNMTEAAAKPTGDAANAFRALGISVTDSNGKLKSSDDVLGDVADKFSGLKDGAGKTAVSMALFGKTGADLIPMLNDGRDGLKEMKDEAEKFGLIIDSKTGKAAEDFNDNLTRLKAAWTGLIVQSMTQVLPSMVEITNAMVESAKNSGFLSAALVAVSTAMKALVTSGVIVGAVFKSLSEYISTVSAAISLVLKGEFTSAFDKVKGGVAGVQETATATFGIIDKLWHGAQSGADGAAASTEKADKVQKDFNFSAMAGKNAIDQFIDSQNKSLESQKAEIATFGQLAGNKEALKIQLQALSIATANHTAITAAQQVQLDLTKQKALDYGMALAGLQLTQQNLTPAQLYQQELVKIQTLFDNGKISAETYEQAMQKTAENAGTAWNIAGASMAGSFATIAASFGKESAGMAKAAQIFGAIQATISMFTGAAKALELPFPANIAAMAAVLAQGARLVSQIKSQSVPTGFKDGLSMTVPGGVGGGDSKLFQAMVEPGEQIDITPNRGGNNRGQAGAGGRAAQPVNVAVPIVTTRDALRDLIDGLNGMFSDGYRLNVVSA